jgi:hypothetical protein
MHVGYRMWAERGIGGLKRKWRRLMKRFYSTKPKVHDLFKVVVAVMLINFLHRCQMDFTFEIIGE